MRLRTNSDGTTERLGEPTKLNRPPNPLPCGCGIKGTLELDHGQAREQYRNLFIDFCPLHAAAPEMLAALEDIRRWADEASIIWAVADAAIAKARGESVREGS